MNEETYYKKILVSSGEVPENSGLYHTDQGQMRYSTFSKNWQDNELPEYWLKPTPVPSPKQEIEQLIEDYKRKIKAVEWLVGGDRIEGARLVTKASCYRTFITELERVIR